MTKALPLKKGKTKEPAVFNICSFLRGWGSLVSLFGYFCWFARRLTGWKCPAKGHGAFKESLRSWSLLPRALGEQLLTQPSWRSRCSLRSPSSWVERCPERPSPCCPRPAVPLRGCPAGAPCSAASQAAVVPAQLPQWSGVTWDEGCSWGFGAPEGMQQAQFHLSPWAGQVPQPQVWILGPSLLSPSPSMQLQPRLPWLSLSHGLWLCWQRGTGQTQPCSPHRRQLITSPCPSE